MAAGPRGDDEEEVASEIAALRRANAALAAKARYLDVVNFFASSLLFTQTDLDDILWDVANNAVARLGLEDCVIYLLDPPGTTLVQRAAFGPKNPKGREILAPITIPVGRGIVGWVAATGEPAVIADTREDPRYITDDQARLSELAIPIVFDDAVIGVLDSEHSQAGFFTQSHLEILTTIASMTASRIGRARLDEALMRANAALEAKVAARTRELSAAIERHERLLVNTLPRPIAQRLGQGEAEIAERFESVTVLFADLVGFTERSASVPAEAVVALLSRIFTAFDSLSDRFGVEKIKTIGDAYMAVAGAPTRLDDHATPIAAMALAMLPCVAAISAEMGTPLAVRIGLASGPVVAGVLGTRKLAYDLWGATVNTASRMESHGLPGMIQVDEAAAASLNHGFILARRGAIKVKGLGAMTTYWLLAQL
jgi:class 3 adenylate cyclase